MKKKSAFGLQAPLIGTITVAVDSTLHLASSKT
mgnify:CR=1 FL=1